MDRAYKAALTATTVALLLAVAQLFGRRLAGILAGRPTRDRPRARLARAGHGAGFAAEAVLGSVAASALCGLFAVGYVRAGRRFGPVVARLAACAAGLVQLPLLVCRSAGRARRAARCSCAP